MVGYIGERARRRRKRFFLFFIFIIIFVIIYYLKPLFELTDIKPTNNLLPTEQEIISPDIKTTIEDLELRVFDKQQKIVFRNKQINELKDEIKSITLENQKLLRSIEKLNITSDSLANNEDLNKLKSEIKRLENIISEFKIKNDKILSEVSGYKIEINSKNKEFKIIFNKNLKLKNINQEYIKKISDLENLIEEQNLIIQLLKDKTPHG